MVGKGHNGGEFCQDLLEMTTRKGLQRAQENPRKAMGQKKNVHAERDGHRKKCCPFWLVLSGARRKGSENGALAW